MNYEYFLFNFFVIIGPIVASFEQRVYFKKKWPLAICAITIVAIPYIIWDALVAGRHWSFNPMYLSGIEFFGLPIEEILFFFTVPFASLFVWEVISSYIPKERVDSKGIIGIFRGLFIVGIILFAQGLKEYTAFAFGALGIVGILDDILQTRLIPQKRTLIYIITVLVCNGIFNGYLTARPIVMYSNIYNLGIRLGTIPVEDFIYGLSLVLLTTITYEFIKQKFDSP